MEQMDTAMARFTAALARLERAASRVESREDAVRAQAAAIARLKRENEALRAAQQEETRLRNETLEQVDRAMEAVERALAHAGRRGDGARDPFERDAFDSDVTADRDAARWAAVSEAARAVDPSLLRDDRAEHGHAEDFAAWDDDASTERPAGSERRRDDRISSAA